MGATRPLACLAERTLMTKARGWIYGCVGVAIAVLASSIAVAQGTAADAFPTRPITLIVPFPAGGPSDTLARAVAQVMGMHLQQAIVIENVSGASGTVGLVRLAKSPP